jgi:hypothetical protein
MDISFKKSIELIDKYDTLNEFYDEKSARRALHNADDNELKYKREANMLTVDSGLVSK